VPLRLTVGKRSASGRLSGRQRPKQTRSEVVSSRSDQATVGRTTSPFGDSYGVCSPLPKLLGARPAYETCPPGTSSPPCVS
jgi:hypothetical protein